MSLETIRAMVTEIDKMKQWCLDNYEQGADTMVECWDSTDYEDLFYTNHNPLDPAIVVGHITVRPRVPFAEAWSRLKSIASIYAERQADARYHAQGEVK
jgi:hypothetical protein